MSFNSFDKNLLTLPEIVTNNLFVIPDYQRGYSWRKKEVEDMLSDIKNLMKGKPSARHFTGTLVLSRVKEGDRYDIVDGQQRLTTLFILMARLNLNLSEEFNHQIKTQYLSRGKIGEEVSVLQLNSDTHNFFREIIVQKGSIGSHPIEIEAQKRLEIAMQVIDKWLDQSKKNAIDLLAVRKTVEEHIGFLVYAPEETAEIGIMFEVINNRGKPLSELEKVKNYLIYSSVKLHANSLRKDIDDSWSHILKKLNVAKKTSAQDEGAFLRYCLVVYYGLSKNDSKLGYDQIKKKLNIENSLNSEKKSEKVIEDIINLISFLKKASVWYARLYGQQHEGLNKDIIECLNQIRSQETHASIMPTFLSIVIKNDKIPHKLLQLLEIINFRVYMSKGVVGRTDTGQAWLYHDAYNYFHNLLITSLENKEYRKFKTEDKALEFRLTEFGICYASDDAFKNSFRLDIAKNDDFYNWQGLKYFLINYEQSLQPNKTIDINKIVKTRLEGKSSDYLSIEHLWATANRSEKGENDRPEDKAQKRRLGNFVILELRLNIKGQDDDLDSKIKLYNGEIPEEASTDFEQVKQVGKIAERCYYDQQNSKRYKGYYYKVYKNIIDQNEQNYIDFAINRWSLEDFYGYKKACEWHNSQD